MEHYLWDMSEGWPEACDVVSQQAFVAFNHWHLLRFCMSTHLAHLFLGELVLIEVLCHPDVCVVTHAERISIDSDRGQELAQVLITAFCFLSALALCLLRFL